MEVSPSGTTRPAFLSHGCRISLVRSSPPTLDPTLTHYSRRQYRDSNVCICSVPPHHHRRTGVLRLARTVTLGAAVRRRVLLHNHCRDIFRSLAHPRPICPCRHAHGPRRLRRALRNEGISSRLHWHRHRVLWPVPCCSMRARVDGRELQRRRQAGGRHCDGHRYWQPGRVSARASKSCLDVVLSDPCPALRRPSFISHRIVQDIIQGMRPTLPVSVSRTYRG